MSAGCPETRTSRGCREDKDGVFTSMGLRLGSYLDADRKSVLPYASMLVTGARDRTHRLTQLLDVATFSTPFLNVIGTNSFSS